MIDPDDLCEQCEEPWTVLVMRDNEPTDMALCRMHYLIFLEDL